MLQFGSGLFRFGVDQAAFQVLREQLVQVMALSSLEQNTRAPKDL